MLRKYRKKIVSTISSCAVFIVYAFSFWGALWNWFLSFNQLRTFLGVTPSGDLLLVRNFYFIALFKFSSFRSSFCKNSNTHNTYNWILTFEFLLLLYIYFIKKTRFVTGSLREPDPSNLYLLCSPSLWTCAP